MSWLKRRMSEPSSIYGILTGLISIASVFVPEVGSVAAVVLPAIGAAGILTPDGV